MKTDSERETHREKEGEGERYWTRKGTGFN